MDPRNIQEISQQLSLSLKQVDNVFQLIREGATIPFMARYRKEATGNLDEVKIGEVVEKIRYFEELEKRKETVLSTIDGLGKLTPALRQRIEQCISATELEDIYLPYKPKRKTRATQAIEKGLEPLAKLLYDLEEVNPAAEAEKFFNEQVKNAEEALQGARDIMAEWISEDERARTSIRHLFTAGAVLSSKLLGTKKEEPEAQKYRDYFEFSEPIAQCPSHRLLAIRRGEKEGFLAMDISIEKEPALDALEKIFITRHNEAAGQLRKALEDAFGRLLKPSIENEFRVLSKNQADEEAIRVFSENLRQLLLAPPLGAKPVLALDPGYRTGCKLVCLDAQGNLLYHTAIYPHPPQSETERSVAQLKMLVEKYQVGAIAVGNGTAGRETEQLVRAIDFGRPVNIFMVNESGASIYSASEVAREEFPDQDVTVRGAISIGRRLLDPLSELVKIDAKSIGVGQYQHDVNQAKLKEALDRVVESAVNFVGVDLNTASRHLLLYVSGLSSSLARNIVEFRAANGPFQSRDQLKKVPLMGPKTFEQCAGFLRIPGAAHPLDNSSVHPERYSMVEKMAADLQATVADLVNRPELRKKIDRNKYIGESVGAYTIEDILRELEKPGRDPRAPLTEFRFEESIRSMEDLKPGMKVPGIVTNITNFGVFVDIGVKQDGLVHISQLSNRYVSDPSEVVKLQQQVMVTVTEVDLARKRIGLSMKDSSSAGRENQPQNKVPRGGRSPQPAKAPLNDFQAKLMELKKKMEK